MLEIRNIKKTFGEHVVLNDISFDIRQGEVVVILGPSGCGKSTLLRCINGLEEIEEGEILFRGSVISGKIRKHHEIRQKIGMVFQNYELFPHMTILKNITLAPQKVQGRSRQEAEKEAETLLKRIGLLDKKNAYPRQLSGGQRQRTAIVRALCMHPEIMLFDEVTASLDPEMVYEVLDVMMEMAKAGRTMVIVTHEMQFARAAADRIIFMDQGKILEEGRPEDFFRRPKTERAGQFLQKMHI
ncbi:MAG TPA: amino acid ABC transporter ATP-binding protein [Candidatus Anaerostipes avistercoris]|uniref:Amino acid ABC transporter ATP-binding protein n=1 Tax=Candidatus Anaerostipes avistercoris TaxID=2838462 RepID=A0A9D2PKU3_9FIRM|nr:amino acid ABC transporter ATP-binding protein [Candidatus Anaerostipes avistercoris]